MRGTLETISYSVLSNWYYSVITFSDYQNGAKAVFLRYRSEMAPTEGLRS